MNRLTRFWHAIEELPGLAALSFEWRALLGDEVDLIKPLLRPRARLSHSFSRPDAGPYGLPYTVVEHGPNDYVGVQSDTGESIALSRDDLIVYEVDRSLLASRAATALGIAVDGTPATMKGATYLGRHLTQDRRSLAVFLTVPFEASDLEATAHRVVASNPAPFILLAPTWRHVRPTAESVVRGNRSALIVLEEMLAAAPGGRFALIQPLDAALRTRLDGYREQVDGTGSRFQKQGNVWVLAFAGKTIQLQDSLGLRYVAHLISQKRRQVHAAMLVATASGNKLVKQVGGSELLDAEAKKAYGDRYDDLLFRLQEAERNNDIATREKTQQEIDKLSHELAAATGLGGRTRKMGDDSEKARKSVSNAITRTITLLEKEHPPLARHLANSIRMGQFLSYAPEADVDWAM